MDGWDRSGWLAGEALLGPSSRLVKEVGRGTLAFLPVPGQPPGLSSLGQYGSWPSSPASGLYKGSCGWDTGLSGGTPSFSTVLLTLRLLALFPWTRG